MKLNRRMLVITLLGFSSGLPLLLIGSTLQAWYTVSDISLMAIGTLTLIGWPYVLKPLWAPILDRFALFPLGRRRSWMLLMQLCLVVGLMIMGLLNPQHHSLLLASIALIVAFFSATQDTAIDAYRTDLLPEHERGMGAACNTFGYRIAMVISGAIALLLAQVLGWHLTYFIMALLMFFNFLFSYRVPRPSAELPALSSLKEAIGKPFQEFFKRYPVSVSIIILSFIVIYKLCDAFALALNTPFLLRGLGFSLVAVASVAKFVSIAASLLGSFVGGILFSQIGLYRSLMYFGFLQMASNLVYALLAIIGKVYWFMGFAVFVEFFCGGLSTVAFVAFLMWLCHKRYTATQFALLSALSAVGRVFIGPLAAYVVNWLGWVDLFIVSFLSGIPALLLLWWLQRKLDFNEALVTHLDSVALVQE